MSHLSSASRTSSANQVRGPNYSRKQTMTRFDCDNCMNYLNAKECMNYLNAFSDPWL